MPAVKQRKQVDIASVLRGDILSGRLEPGQRLTELELSQRFHAGRGLVRQALQQLALQGLVTTKKNCGVTVSAAAPKDIREVIVPIRRTIEIHALRYIYDDLMPVDFARWDEILADMKAACRKQDIHSAVEADVAFHRYLVERAGQPDLMAIWEMLVGRIRSHFRRAQRQVTSLMDIHEEHREILDAFRAGDEDAAVKLLHARIE
jgi:DNA-binding GntR family transcriptional regulator